MPDKKKPTTRDIAKACFVSQSAVSMILSGRTDMHFSKETVELVQRTATEMGYVYKPRNRRAKTDMKSTIMIMCPVSFHSVLYHADSGHHPGGPEYGALCPDRLHKPS